MIKKRSQINSKNTITGIVILLLITTISCAGGNSKENSSQNAKITGYWDFSPETKQSGKTPKPEEQKDWFYLQYTAKASPNAIERGQQTMMQTTCRDAAKIQGKSELSKLLFMTSMTEAGLCHPEEESSFCTTFASENFSAIKSFNIQNCEPTGIGPEPDKKPGSWEECQCELHANYPGGKAAIVQKAKAAK
ncbi:MAG: hypothetical protein K8R21_04210 [Leptospira sp.]|nr:hypothetical protein [Leptospira sp.]